MFQLQTTNPNAVVRDFHPSEGDHILFLTGSDPKELTHNGDLWTVHGTDHGDITYELVGVTDLDPSYYSFV